MLIDHIFVPVSDLEASRTFYERVLAPLGQGLLMSRPGVHGFGSGGKPEFWIRAGSPEPMHIAFSAPDRATVDAFHAAALEAGGRDNGAPGVREIYHPNYYGAFVLDPDGHNIEAVVHAPGLNRSG